VVDFNNRLQPALRLIYRLRHLPAGRRTQNKLAIAVEAGEKKFVGGPEH